jgi:hypothetical protein
MEPGLEVDSSSRRRIDGLGASSFEENGLLVSICPVEGPYCVHLPADYIEFEDTSRSSPPVPSLPRRAP